VIAKFDILRHEKNGALWVCATTTLEEAHARIYQDSRSSPAEYVIFNSTTGERISVDLGGNAPNQAPKLDRSGDAPAQRIATPVALRDPY
jgi:hypothetical protein